MRLLRALLAVVGITAGLLPTQTSAGQSRIKVTHRDGIEIRVLDMDQDGVPEKRVLKGDFTNDGKPDCVIELFEDGRMSYKTIDHNCDESIDELEYHDCMNTDCSQVQIKWSGDLNRDGKDDCVIDVRENGMLKDSSTDLGCDGAVEEKVIYVCVDDSCRYIRKLRYMADKSRKHPEAQTFLLDVDEKGLIRQEFADYGETEEDTFTQSTTFYYDENDRLVRREVRAEKNKGSRMDVEYIYDEDGLYGEIVKSGDVKTQVYFGRRGHIESFVESNRQTGVKYLVRFGSNGNKILEKFNNDGVGDFEFERQFNDDGSEKSRSVKASGLYSSTSYPDGKMKSEVFEINGLNLELHYDAQGRLTKKVEDLAKDSNNKRITRYVYDKKGCLIAQLEDGQMTIGVDVKWQWQRDKDCSVEAGSMIRLFYREGGEIACTFTASFDSKTGIIPSEYRCW